MTNQKSLSISHVNVGYATRGKFSLISLLMELRLTIFQQCFQPESVCVFVRDAAQRVQQVCMARQLVGGFFFPATLRKTKLFRRL